MRQRSLDVALAMLQLRHPRYLLPQCQWRRILQMGAADLDNVGKFDALGLERTMQLCNRRRRFCSTAVTAATCIAVG